ncbi:MAG: LysE family translocator [Bacteroidaceae bacterium]|nr:LysE family translocator [Bacteroidaceae bacterium]
MAVGILFLLCIKGFLIGALAAMPLGPSAFLVMKRTLNGRGQRAGLFTGIGIGISDIIYATLAAIGVGLVVSWLENQTVALMLNLAGCVILSVFGIVTVVNNPFKKDVQTIRFDENTVKYYIGTGFLIAIANPLVIIFYLTLFAAFAFTPGTADSQSFYLGLLSVLTGDFCWWMLLTYVINKIRNRFDLKQIRTINTWFGILLIVGAGAWLIYTLFRI